MGADDDANVDLFAGISSCWDNNMSLEELDSYDEWHHLQLPPGWVLGGDIEIAEEVDDLLSPEESAKMLASMNLADLSIDVQGAPVSSVTVGDNITLSIEIPNAGPNAAAKSMVRLVLPGGVTHVSDTAGCIMRDTTVLECDLGLIWYYEQKSFDVSLSVGPNNTCEKREILLQTMHLEGADAKPDDNTVTIPLFTVPAFIDFEDASRPWVGQYGSANPVIVTSPVSSGTHAMRLACGFSTIDSPTFDSAEIEMMGTQVSVEVYIPQNVSNPYWVGDMGLFLVAPAGGIWDEPIGNYANFTTLPRGSWSTVTFPLSPTQVQALRGDLSDVRFRIRANNGSCGSPVILDNLRFTGTMTPRTVFHACGSNEISVSSSTVLTFDSLSDWSANVPLSSDRVQLTEGTASLAFTPASWTLLTSADFSTDDLENVSSLLNLDIFVPELPPDPDWVGYVQAYLECPSANLYNFYMDQVSLDYLFDGEFNSTGYRALKFDIPDTALNVLQGSYNDCVFKFALSVNPSWGTFRFDNGGFIQ